MEIQEAGGGPEGVNPLLRRGAHFGSKCGSLKGVSGPGRGVSWFPSQLAKWHRLSLSVMCVWQFVESTSFIIRTERFYLASERKPQQPLLTMLDDSDNGASGYTDWDCIFHLHFKMQMSRCVVVCKPIPPKGNSSMVPQMRPNFYWRLQRIRVYFGI